MLMKDIVINEDQVRAARCTGPVLLIQEASTTSSPWTSTTLSTVRTTGAWRLCWRPHPRRAGQGQGQRGRPSGH